MKNAATAAKPHRSFPGLTVSGTVAAKFRQKNRPGFKCRSSMDVPENSGSLLAQAKAKTWIVYAKKPFAGPEQVLEYLGRYTHR
ncbi:MAG: transposase, partial [Thermodesulfobacteriota bacterium]